MPEIKDARLVVLVEPSQKDALLALSKKSGISLGEIVRRALTFYVAAQTRVVQREEQSALSKAVEKTYFNTGASNIKPVTEVVQGGTTSDAAPVAPETEKP